MRRIILCFSVLLLNSCGGGQSFDSVKIGYQEWMLSNLNTSEFQNGEKIFEAKTAEEWQTAGREERAAWCYYDFNQDNEKLYGKLYNWFAVNDSRGIAPNGWHISNSKEWNSLSNAVKVDQSNFTGQAYDCKKSKFNMVSGGRCTSKGIFIENEGHSSLAQGVGDKEPEIIGNNGAWWTSTALTGRNSAYSETISCDGGGGSWQAVEKGAGFPVRCVKDK